MSFLATSKLGRTISEQPQWRAMENSPWYELGIGGKRIHCPWPSLTTICWRRGYPWTLSKPRILITQSCGMQLSRWDIVAGINLHWWCIKVVWTTGSTAKKSRILWIHLWTKSNSVWQQHEQQQVNGHFPTYSVALAPRGCKIRSGHITSYYRMCSRLVCGSLSHSFGRGLVWLVGR